MFLFHQTSLEDSPGFYADEWYRRRSERIFLHKSADDNSRPTARSVAGERTSVTLSSIKSTAQTTGSKSAVSPAPRTAASTVLLTSPKQTTESPQTKSRSSGSSTDTVLGVIILIAIGLLNIIICYMQLRIPEYLYLGMFVNLLGSPRVRLGWLFTSRGGRTMRPLVEDERRRPRDGTSATRVKSAER